MIDSGRIMEQAEALLHRLTPEARARARRARRRRAQRMLRVLARMAAATVLILGAMIGAGLMFGPLGFPGALATLAALLLAYALILAHALRATPSAPEQLAGADLPLLPSRTEAWLDRQRPALPAPAIRLVDAIELRLDALAPQLRALDPRDPAALEVRKLIADELPELVTGYQRVPKSLRRAPGATGVSPDRQLLDGLGVVESELGRMSAQLASGDLHKLATQGRYLELKYRGDGGVA